MAPDPTMDTIELHTADGVTLMADVCGPADHERQAAAVLCHPHPLHGGNRHVPLVSALFRALPRRGVLCVRFDFRGAGQSHGEHDGGKGEQHDVRAAVDEAMAAVPNAPVWLVGWSFGADVSLSVDHEAVAGWLAIAPPLRVFDVDDLVAGRDARPVRLLVPEHDQFNPPVQAIETTEDWENCTVRAIGGDDHFLHRSLDVVVDMVSSEIVGV